MQAPGNYIRVSKRDKERVGGSKPYKLTPGMNNTSSWSDPEHAPKEE
jgi:hypothetical protein